MSDKNRINELQSLLRRHQEAILKQNKLYVDNLTEKIRNKPVGAGLDVDDLSKVAENDIIGKGGDSTEALRK